MALRHLQLHLPRYALESELFPVGMMIFFFVIFDGVLMYLAPIVITSAGLSESMMGLLIGSSSVAGMLFDLVLCRVFKSTNYRRMFLGMFVMAMLYPLFLFGGTTVTIYLFAMAVWGFYYNFYNIGTIDFVGRTTNPAKHASSFGILRVFESSGYLLAPFVGSLLLIYFHPGPLVLLAVAVPLTISFLLYVLIVMHPRKEKDEYTDGIQTDKPGILKEMRLWKVLGGPLLPALLLTLAINLIDAAIWTFGPIFSEKVGLVGGFSGGMFMTAYALPPLLVGWIVGVIARRLGMKRTAQGAILLGSLLLIPVGFVTSPLLLIPLIFSASFCLAVGWPAINAVYTENVDTAPEHSKEIETLQDLFTNVGDTAGPIIGGYLGQYLGSSHAFVALGAVGAGIALYLHVTESLTSF